jgi:hypothetical protein
MAGLIELTDAQWALVEQIFDAGRAGPPCPA